MGVASWLERRPLVLALRLALTLETASYSSSKRSNFSDLSRLLQTSERPFARPTLEKQLVEMISSSISKGQYCVIVGGPGGIGKSVFWEALFQKRPRWGAEGVWSALPGPTRVVNLLKCKNLAEFEDQVVDTFVPQAILPSFGLSPPETYASAMEILNSALWMLSTLHRLTGFAGRSALIMYIEDINRLASFDGWQKSFVPLASTIASSGNAIIVGNSSALLAYRNFERLPHTGLRTSTVFTTTFHTLTK